MSNLYHVKEIEKLLSQISYDDREKLMKYARDKSNHNIAHYIAHRDNAVRIFKTYQLPKFLSKQHGIDLPEALLELKKFIEEKQKK